MDLQLTKTIAKELCQDRRWHGLEYLDAGNSGAVFRVEHPQHGPVALKIYDPAYFKGDNALIEENRIRLQEQLRSHGNPHLIDILEVGSIPTANTWYLLMELCSWPNLEKCLPSDLCSATNVGIGAAYRKISSRRNRPKRKTAVRHLL